MGDIWMHFNKYRQVEMGESGIPGGESVMST